MRRKHDAHKDELEGVAQRLRNERPELSPLELDRIKTTAMSRAKASRRGRAGARRLATAGLTVGLLAAGTGGVIAEHHGKGGGNAANSQYGGECNIQNGNGNSGNNNGNENENNACNENTFITTTNNNTGGTTINNYFSTVTVSATPVPTSGVQGAKTTKAKTSKRHIKFHINVSRKSHLRKVTLKVNGKVLKVLKGKQASANINLVNLPCSNGGTTVTITAVTSSGKTITESHTYHLCQA
jgi:hypothetical protein